MANIGGTIGYALGTIVRGTGTVAVGGVGVVCKAIGNGSKSMSKEASKQFNQMGDSCFGYAKSMWTGKKYKSKRISYDRKTIEDILKKVQNEIELSKIQLTNEFLNNKATQRRVLKNHGMDPSLADDPRFTAFIQKKYKEYYQDW